MEAFAIIKVLTLAAISFVIAISWTPLLTHYLYKYKLGKQIRDDGSTPIFSELHAGKSGTPTMGGLLIWVTVLFLALVLAYLSLFFPDSFIGKLSFLSRPQTLLPLGALVASAMVGIIDDLWNVRRIGPNGGGLKMKHRLMISGTFSCLLIGLLRTARVSLQ